MQNAMFVVDRNLQAIKLNQVLDASHRLKDYQVVTPKPPTGLDRPIVEGQDNIGALQPNQLYSSAADASLKFYLPHYQISTMPTGQPAVELRYGEKGSGEKGRLTITTTWTAPVTTANIRLKIMEHTADLTLRYRIPIKDQASTGTNGGEQAIALQPLERLDGNVARSITIFTDKAQFDTVYQAMKQPEYAPALEINIKAPVGLRTWRQVFVGQVTEYEQADVLKRKQALVTKVLDTRRLTVRPPSKAQSSAQVKLAIPRPEETMRIEATRQVLSEVIPHPAITFNPGLAQQNLRVKSLNTAAVSANTRMMPLMATAAAPAMTSFAKAAPPQVTASPAVMRAMATPLPSAVTAQAVVAKPVAIANPAMMAAAVQGSAGAIAMKPQITADTMARVNTPQLSQAVLASDLMIHNQSMVPTVMPLDRFCQPAIVDIELSNQQILPFSFDPLQHPAVYVTEGFVSSGPHLLLPLLLRETDGTTHLVYQDNLMREVVYIAPSEFRLQRDTQPPFLPAIQFLPSDFSTTTNDQEADVLFRMAVVYRLEPWIDPDVMELAQRAIPGARLTPIVPRDAQLSLTLPYLEDGQQRQNVEINPSTAITDNFELDYNAFTNLWQQTLTQPTGGIGGRVDYTLFDGTLTQSPVRLSFFEESPRCFEISYAGPVPGQEGGHRFMVRNRLESPVRITQILEQPSASAAGISAVNPAALISQVLKSQEVIALDYQVPAGAAGAIPAEPTLFGEVQPDFKALLKLLLVKPGYDALSFPLTVQALEGTFQANKTIDGEALSGLLVEFDDGTRVTLTPGDETAEVTLVGRLIDQILGTNDDQQRYFYRVTNLTSSGEGARTGWLERRGVEGVLKVPAVVAQLDF
ncbi:hypothetical protein VB780_24595 [Leptolyngbya sp. CCNP1308]|uniref:hypothetical protein n=1 Tax=Leptolyngbya sp. CCNP1308 TaxID=3110255 RepID=UPI002B205EBA|nr:hypothetical protein [Leptolyngbya sp. CCNP1308]MEA5451779.1 hypothetical protein [Leptolyngbya sp. CCNP1308]